jgi:cytochrome c oxidase assembly protein subunit 15
MTAPPESPTPPTALAAPPAKSRRDRGRPSPSALPKLTLAALVTNIAIVASGGLVRLTGSGLGCPSWPNCTGSSLVPTRELSWHKYVEFGNRLFTYVEFVAVLAALIGVLRTVPRRPELRLLAWLTFLGVPAQAVMGGITVLTDLNPWAVAAHFVLSMLIVAAATLLWWRSRLPSPPPTADARPPHPLLRRLAGAVWGLTYVVFAAGTVVTGAGPHAGDPAAPRIPVKAGSLAQLHADLVMLLVGMSVALAVAVTAAGVNATVQRTTWLLVAALAAQAVIGFAQYFAKLPIGLVELHLLGAALIAAAATAVVAAMRDAATQVSRSAGTAPPQPRRTTASSN